MIALIVLAVLTSVFWLAQDHHDARHHQRSTEGRLPPSLIQSAALGAAFLILTARLFVTASRAAHGSDSRRLEQSVEE
ncbi:hypothetical protein ACZ90_00210 [Streptomyces albus subsp. albus]|nr:hypothetical protein ACZ90_00210 [Streptomyces albus subsp. albus]